jgi:hypothetical protein
MVAHGRRTWVEFDLRSAPASHNRANWLPRSVLGTPRNPRSPRASLPTSPAPVVDKPATPTSAVPNAATFRQTDAPLSVIGQISEIQR